MMSYLSIHFPPFPPLSVHCQNEKVCALVWKKGTREGSETPLLKELLRDLKAYFEGQEVRFDWPLDWGQGTPFQQEVWRALQTVPYGETRSYQWIADSIHQPRAVRAVGNANGKNPFPLVIPCHRIIRKNGSIGGYSGGLSIKRQLLALEGATTV